MDLNVAIIGPGHIASMAIGPAIQNLRGVRVWSVLSRSQDRATASAYKLGALAPTPAYTQYDRLLADPELDAVIICTPDRLHAEQGIQAARAGKHVFVEKPIATNAIDARELIRACQDASVQLSVGYHLRWHIGHQQLWEMVNNDELGQIEHMAVRWTSLEHGTENWRAHSELGRWWGLAQRGTHGVDLICWFMAPTCGEIRKIRSIVTHGRWDTPHDETALVLFEFDSGATAALTSSVLFKSDPLLEIYGHRGSAICRRTLGPSGEGNIEVNGKALDYSPVNPYEAELEDFVSAVKNNRPPRIGAHQGLRNVELLEKIADSAEREEIDS